MVLGHSQRHSLLIAQCRRPNMPHRTSSVVRFVPVTSVEGTAPTNNNGKTLGTQDRPVRATPPVLTLHAAPRVPQKFARVSWVYHTVPAAGVQIDGLRRHGQGLRSSEHAFIGQGLKSTSRGAAMTGPGDDGRSEGRLRIRSLLQGACVTHVK
ncbi:hypothetical protein C8Q78DRAFT_1036851 [Trametes maxima]|nr:hypothetical protein C8Q78DRAFT_1036851 [Trametes maxima]